jgi:hypothetical protein
MHFILVPKEVGWEDVDCTDMAWNKDRWRAVVNAVLNLQVQKNVGNFVTN